MIFGNLFEQVAKFRAGRRLWATILKEEYGAKDPKTMWMRMIAGGGGFGLTIEQPENNIVRGAYYALIAALSGAQTVALCCYDEAYTIPSEKAQRISLRTMQILIEEMGLCDTVDPLGGSYFVEALTDATEEKIIEIMHDLEMHGGMVRCIEDGYLQGLIADEAYKIHQEVESGERPVVGVNKFVTEEDPPEIATYELDAEGRDMQLKRLSAVKAERDGAAVEAALAALARSADGDDNLMHKLIDCANAYCTVGEMVTTLKSVWGEFQQPVVF